jgi:hypothetical protein
MSGCQELIPIRMVELSNNLLRGVLRKATTTNATFATIFISISSDGAIIVSTKNT